MTIGKIERVCQFIRKEHRKNIKHGNKFVFGFEKLRFTE